MTDTTAIDEEIVTFGEEKQRVVIALKQAVGRVYIDLRKWNPVFLNPSEFHPSAKGLMLRFEQWPVVIAGINRMIAAHNGTQKPIDASQ